MDALWTHGASSVREIQERFPEKDRPAYTTVQTMVYRLEGKKAIRRIKKIGNAHIFEAAISRNAAQRRLIDDLLELFRRPEPTGHGSSDRVRQFDARRRPRGRANAEEAGEEEQGLGIRG